MRSKTSPTLRAFPATKWALAMSYAKPERHTSWQRTFRPFPSGKSNGRLFPRLREFVWVGGCVITPTMWASPPGRRPRSVHRLAKMASPRRFGAFVYTIGPWAWVVGSLGIATVYTNGRIGPLRAVLERLCTLLGCCAVVDRRGDAGVYTNRWKWPLRAGLGRLCTLLRRESRYELRRELCQVARAPQPPWRVGGASLLAPLAWSGRQTLSERRRCQVGILAEASTHTNP